ncbi:putative alanine racemase-domain-containing protein [Pilobolus umbonatus]|nr:putative alanine racemase-domain-containing protein [Pilobolus umbonatus]
MVQDNGLGQEMFLSAYNTKDKDGNTKMKCYRYADDPIEAEIDENKIDNECLGERTLVYCVSPPGENEWSKKIQSPAEDLLQQLNTLDIRDMNEAVLKKYPLAGQSHTGAIVKFYNDMGDSTKVGQLIEIIGIKGRDVQKNTDDDHEFSSVLNAFSDVPVLHAIAYNTLDRPISVLEDIHHQIYDIRQQVVSYIASVLGDDQLSAEYVLLQLLSRVTTKSTGFKLGNFSLNLSGFPNHITPKTDKDKLCLSNPASKCFADVISNLTAHSVELPLTIDTLNGSKFSPKSVNENLESGLLQLVDGTTLIVDETVLNEGQLVDSGVRNFQALHNLILNQTLTYEFPYSQFNFDTDINVLTLSTSKSMLPNHCAIRIEAKHPLSEHPTTHQVSEDNLHLFRQYIQSARYAGYDIPQASSEYIQTSFVNERKDANQRNMILPTQEDLMLRMSLARLAALSFGETDLTPERYDYVVHLERQRRMRTTVTQPECVSR